LAQLQQGFLQIAFLKRHTTFLLLQVAVAVALMAVAVARVDY
jgi:hypothetical protein